MQCIFYPAKKNKKSKNNAFYIKIVRDGGLNGFAAALFLKTSEKSLKITQKSLTNRANHYIMSKCIIGSILCTRALTRSKLLWMLFTSRRQYEQKEINRNPYSADNRNRFV